MLKKFGITLITDKIEEVRAFYEKYFQARAHFDCGWYVNLVLQNPSDFEVCLMRPQSEEGKLTQFAGGVTLNLKFDDVEPIYQHCVENHAPFFMPLEDHPWGDRGFSIHDPVGTIVYCYHLIPPSPEFQAYFK